MKTRALQPVSDISVQWSQFPNDAGVHALKVDDGFATPDNGTTYVFKTAGNQVLEAVRLQDLPPDFKSLVAARVRAWAWSSDALSTIAFEVLIDGVAYDDPAAIMTFTSQPLSTWVSFQVTLSVLPALTGAEEIWLNPLGNLAGGELRITQEELEIDYVPYREHGDPSCNSPGASASGQSQGGTPSASAQKGAPSSTAHTGTPTSAAPGANASSTAQAAAPASSSPKGSVSPIDDCTAQPASTAPGAVPLSTAPAGTPSSTPPSGEAA